MHREQLIRFEEDIARRFENKEIPGPIHLSGGNEDQLIDIFKSIRRDDYVFSTWRSHYHALLHGVPEVLVMEEILKGKSMSLMFPDYHFFTSGIVGGVLSIAVGVAYAIRNPDLFYSRRVHCFVGDMTSTTGIFHESVTYAEKQDLPITFYVEDNGLSCNTPTGKAWGEGYRRNVIRYVYDRIFPHCGCGKWVNF